MTRISKIEPEHWDPALREMTRPDTATACFSAARWRS